LGNKNKLQRFAENLTFNNLFQYRYEEVVNGFPLKGQWHEEFFKNNGDIVVEMGCGKGEYTLGLARKFPEKNFIGVDIKGARMWRGLKTAEEEGLKNVAFIRTRIEIIPFYFAKDEVSEIWITFPDPQIRAIKEKKRLTSHRFLSKYHQFLKPGGVIHLKTDALLLYDYTLEVIEKGGHQLLYANEDIYGNGLKGAVTQIQTFYEKKWMEYDTPIKYLKFSLNPDFVPEQFNYGQSG